MALACLVLLASAVPVMADPGPEPPAPGTPVLQASEYTAPDAAAVNTAYQAHVREEEEREAELEEEPFVAQRASSLHAYDDASPAEAEELLRSTFGGTFAELNGEPARLLGEVKLDGKLGHRSAVITDEGRHQILEADMPVEAKDAVEALGRK